MIVGVDFDGTVVEHTYPGIGPAVPGALRVLRLLQASGTKLVLWTMRSGAELDAAVRYLNENGIELWGVNSNPEQKQWTNSPKAYCQLYVDDAAVGCPLVRPQDGRRPYVDWHAVERLLAGEALPDEIERQHNV